MNSYYNPLSNFRAPGHDQRLVHNHPHLQGGRLQPHTDHDHAQNVDQIEAQAGRDNYHAVEKGQAKSCREASNY